MRSTLIAAVGFWRVLAELIIEALWREHTPVPPQPPWTDGTDWDIDLRVTDSPEEPVRQHAPLKII